MPRNIVISVLFATNLQARSRRFSVPEKVARALDLEPHDEIALTIHDTFGKPLFRGTNELKSGLEIYGRAAKPLRPGMAVIVEASVPPRGAHAD